MSAPPSDEALRRYPGAEPPGHYDDGVDEPHLCACVPDCAIPCKGGALCQAEPACEACSTAYADYLSCR